jgi:ubiquitin C-terminal hydrolase
VPFSRSSTAGGVLDKVVSDASIRAALKLPVDVDASMLRSCLRVWFADLQTVREKRQQEKQPDPVPSSQNTMAEDGKEGEEAEEEENKEEQGPPEAKEVDVPLEEMLACRTPFHSDKTIDEVAKNDISSVFFIELRDNQTGLWSDKEGPWYAPGCEPVGATYSDETLKQWRSSVREGSFLDAADKSQWTEAVVVEMKGLPGSTKSGIVGSIANAVGFNKSPTHSTPSNYEVTVRYRGWSPAFINKYNLTDFQKLAPLHFHTRPWRQGIRVGDAVEYAVPAPTPANPEAREWVPALVVAIDHSVLPPTLTLRYTEYKKIPTADGKHVDRFEIKDPAEGGGDKTVAGISLEDSEILSPKGTHVHDAFVRKGLVLPAYPDAPPLITTPSWVQSSWKGPEKVASVVSSSSTSGESSSSGGGGLLGIFNRSTSGVTTRGQAQAASDAEAAAAMEAGDLSKVIQNQALHLTEYFRGPFDGKTPFENPCLDLTKKAFVAPPGLCGLDNLGNTCFMNSLLQCVSNTMELTDFFVSNEYLREINANNILGANGNLAQAYGALMHAMWSGSMGRVAPQKVKAIVAKKAPQFMGWGQQDSQEFASFLLDLLLEDLCRIKKKPYVPLIEDKEKEGKTDQEIAERYWDDHKKRNDSKITDIFAGQYKSRVKCNKCNTTSLAFDPFTSLTVPIPVEKYQFDQVFWFGLDNQRPIMAIYHWLPSDGDPTGQDVAEWLVDVLAQHYEFGADYKRPVVNEDVIISPANVLRWRERRAERRERALKQMAARGDGKAAAAATGGLPKADSSMDEDDDDDDETPSSVNVPSPAAGGKKEAEFILLNAGTREEVLFINGHRMPQPWEILLCVTWHDPFCAVQTVIPHWASVGVAQLNIQRTRSLRSTNLMIYHVPGAPSYEETAASPVPRELQPDYDEFEQVKGSAAPAADSDDDEYSGPFSYFNNKKKPAAAAKRPSLRVKPRPNSPIGPLRSDYANAWLRFEGAKNVNNFSYGYHQNPKLYEAAGDSVIIPLRWIPDPVAVPSSAEVTDADFDAAASGSSAATVTLQPAKRTGVSAGTLLPPGQEMTQAQFREAAFRSFYRFVNHSIADQTDAENVKAKIGYTDFPYEERSRFWHKGAEVAMEVAFPHDRVATIDHNAVVNLMDGGNVVGTRRVFETRQYIIDLPRKEELYKLGKEGGQTVRDITLEAKPRQKEITLNDCLKRFSVEEQLSEDNKWRCPTCKEEVRAYKKMSVWKLPPVLIVHLKRFLYERSTYLGNSIKGKIDNFVNFPITGLDLKDYVEGPIDPSTGSLYDLYAVSEHSGGLGGGEVEEEKGCLFLLTHMCAAIFIVLPLAFSSLLVFFQQATTLRPL